MNMAESDDEKRIEDLASTLKKSGLAASKEDALASAQRIILGSKTKPKREVKPVELKEEEKPAEENHQTTLDASDIQDEERTLKEIMEADDEKVYYKYFT